MTTKLLAFTAAAFLAIPGAAGAQAVNGYGSAGRAAIVDEDGLLLTHYGGGLDLITGSGLGASLEAGRTGRSGVWINHVSVDGTYHWSRTARRVTSFIAGGDSRFFAEGEGANTFNIGGGVDVWVEPPSTQHGYAALRARLLSKRFAVAASSYSSNGSSLADAMRRTHQPSGVFALRAGQPQRTYVLDLLFLAS